MKYCTFFGPSQVSQITLSIFSILCIAVSLIISGNSQLFGPHMRKSNCDPVKKSLVFRRRSRQLYSNLKATRKHYSLGKLRCSNEIVLSRLWSKCYEEIFSWGMPLLKSHWSLHQRRAESQKNPNPESRGNSTQKPKAKEIFLEAILTPIPK